MISIAQPLIFKWHSHVISIFRLFMHTCTYFGCHHPPYVTGTPLHHLLALCHHHPTLPSPWATPRSTLACAHTHVCLIGAPSTHFPVDFYRFLVHPRLRSHYNTLMLGAHTTCTVCQP